MPASVTALRPPGPAAAVRRQPCHLCRAVPGQECTAAGDHLARWLAAYTAGRITRAQLTDVIAGLVVVTRWQVIGPDGTA